ncbi:hypothetical protein ACIRQQ_05035 [Streptomyces fuscichromogenes]|uniref:hypothetical protein n=1 Tax=Streptomyces fuscichromogenes TaxID=1324013 RepID=UPI003819B68B
MSSARSSRSSSATPPTGRTASGLIARAGLIAHLVEQPAVASDAARLRLQAMADHSDDDVDAAIDILDTCIRSARETIASTRRAA